MASATVAFNAIVVEALNQHNYKDWSSQVQTYLLAEDLWEVVKSKKPRPESKKGKANMSDEAWRTKDAKALHAIKISCGTEIFSFIRDAGTANKAWKDLENQFKSNVTLYLEKKERKRSRRIANKAGQKRKVGDELELSDEDLEMKAAGEEEKKRSLHTANKAGQKRKVGKELELADEDLEMKAGEGEKKRSLHTANKARQKHKVGKELVLADEDLEMKAGEGGNENIDEFYIYGRFFGYVKKGDWDNAKECLATLNRNTIRVKDPKTGNTALHFAARRGHVHIVKELVLLMTPEDLEIKEKHGHTALHKAVIKGNVDIVTQLVALMRPEGLRIKSKNGDTALHRAVGWGEANIVKELVSLMTPEDLEITENEGYTALHIAVIEKNVDIVKQLVAVMRPEGLGIKSKDNDTALHIAVSLGQVNIVKDLVLLMRKKDLKIKNCMGYTALGEALNANLSDGDLLQIATYMVEKNKKTLGIILRGNVIPVVEACGWSKWELCRYLYPVTPLEVLTLKDGTQGALLISMCIRQGKGLDIAWDLLQLCPRLAIQGKGVQGSPMLVLAHMRYAFLSGKQLTFWQKFIYNSIHIQPVDFSAPEISINVSKSEDDQGNQRDPICKVLSLYRRIVKGRLVKLLGINHMYEMKSTHIRVYDFLRLMGEVTTNEGSFTLAERNVVISSIFKAVELGNVEFVMQLCKANPSLVHALDEKGRNIFQYAIECREEGIYNLMYGLKKEDRNHIRLLVTGFNNTMLHSAATLSPVTHIQGASLQMQRELQWFKEVKSIVPVEKHEFLNYSDGLTAQELFTKNHKKLMKEAEISMKGTATSCTTVGALIVTIMFAVAFTVPGGTNGNTGFPTFMHKKLFKVFIVSDIISLASSSTSVITFLGILTSRYAEDDFLKSLPKKMMVGLSALFISIATMMITFSCALTIMLDGKAWIIIPSIMFASIPVISFVWFLFPLLFEICISTYGPGIFDRNLKPWY